MQLSKFHNRRCPLPRTQALTILSQPNTMTVSPPLEPIAVIGSACRFPGGSTTPSKLWELLRQPRDVRREFNPDILNLRRFQNAEAGTHGSVTVKNQGYLLADDPRFFDAGFFGISPYEAENMDPQQRVLLETVYETMESAGYTLDQMQGSRTSVHVGVMTADYFDIQARDPDTISQYTGTGTSRSILSNRISYVFDLHGPSVTVDTACSSSLVALHQAVQSLRSGEANCALVGGVNIILDPVEYMVLSSLHMLSPDSQSRMWDKTANGYARGEGVAAVMLKPLSHAVRDNDPIEGIIRGIGVNSDGRSPGITMPTVAGQTSLIRETYQRAGLDPVRDRCQYFEAHGTGTKAGDPIEARAIYESMIGVDPNSNESSDPLYVGSIKTLIGHLEGAAGLAGLLKVLQAIKHRTIPPNMLFQNLNPDIEPYYKRLKIPTNPVPWPKVPPGTPLRASVNSFGFGGTNAHVIVESYEPDTTDEVEDEREHSEMEPIAPFVLSAHSGSALLKNVQSLVQYLYENPSLDLADLTHVLRNRRTVHRVKTFFSGETRQRLLESLEAFVMDHDKTTSMENTGIQHRRVNPDEIPGVLGVFTGQGAQWPMMGHHLIGKCTLFRETIEDCDKALKSLSDGPKWSLLEELSKEASSSRMHEAEISQPLCTAIQLALIEVLQASGIHFDAVVGHSSGEIAAVYACGIISLPAAMQIAYYRGKYAHLAHGTNGLKGAMLAVGIGYKEAQLFCERSEYQGRVAVAASNAPQSVTLSGDLDAVHEVKAHFDEEGTFTRLLQVDTAYHSHHMTHCAKAYLKSLTSCDIQIRPPREGCFWISSVRGDTELLRGDLATLKGSYWVQNMVQTVLFSQAVRSSIWHGGPFDLAVEVGPHPALRRPTEQTLESAFGFAPAYAGTLKRGNSDVEAFSDTIGSVWAHLGPAFVDWEGFRTAFSITNRQPKIPEGLPPYSWDHDRVYWRESRVSTRFRKGQDATHELLGRRTPDDDDRELRWRNILKLSELPWLTGHEVSGNILLPGASYVSLALEAGKAIAGDRQISLMEVQNTTIHRPVVVPDGRDGYDTVFSVRLRDSSNPNLIIGDFSYSYCPGEKRAAMVHTCDGRLLIHLGEPSVDELPFRGPTPRDLLPVDVDEAHQTLANVGVVHSGIFRRIKDIQRRMDYAVSTAEWPEKELGDQYVMHPALLDVAFQNAFYANADPYTRKLTVPLVPVFIERVAVNPNTKLCTDIGKVLTTTESFITSRDGLGFSGDLHIYNLSDTTSVQVERLVFKPVAPPTEEHDRHMFYDTVYQGDPSLQLTEPQTDPASTQTTLYADIERVVLFHVQKVLREMQPGEKASFTWYHQRLISAFEHWLDMVQDDRHPLAKKAWLEDGQDVVDGIYLKWPGQVDLELVRELGKSYMDILRGTTPPLQVLMENDRIGRIYTHGGGFAEVNRGMADVAGQIANKFPRARYLEIGAGTGSTTDYVFQSIGQNFDTYTYTDISPGFFENAAKRFADYENKMLFKTLDLEKDALHQGYSFQAYDVIIASNVLHATASITKSLEHVRSLLRPGGFLLLVEVTGMEIMRTGFCVGALPGWWLGGADGGRWYHPGLSVEEWDDTLQKTGFSGVDLTFHDSVNSSQQCISFLASQSVNDTLLQMREPLEYLHELPQTAPLYIIGGKTLPVSKLASAVQRISRRAWNDKVLLVSDIEEIDFSQTPDQMDILCLQELDKALFSDPVTPRRLKALQNTFSRTRNMLWVTKNRRAGNAQSNMMPGIARCLRQELPRANVQFLDVERINNAVLTARTIFENFMRLQIHASNKDAADYLWTQESELIIEGSNILLSRLQPSQELNDRYIACYRNVTKSVCSSNATIGIIQQRRKLALAEVEHRCHTDNEPTIQIKVDVSITIPEGGRRISFCIGKRVNDTTKMLAVSEENTSFVSVSQRLAIPIHKYDCDSVLLERVYNRITAKGLLCRWNQGPVLVYNAEKGLAMAIQQEASSRGIGVLFASCLPSAPADWIRLHPRMSVRAIQGLVPSTISIYLECPGFQGSAVPSITSALPSSCNVARPGLDLVKQGLGIEPGITLRHVYEELLGYHRAPADQTSISSAAMLDVRQLSSADPSILDQIHITSWEATEPLNVTVQPPDASLLFDSSKTYLMVGMSGGLGLSICEWALRHGAKHLVITSRTPNIDPEWLARARRRGANVQVQPMDVANRASVEHVVHDIRENLPPIGGVCNAAMVLADNMFVDMDAESFNRALRPKVDGSKNLDEIFADYALDFFIMLSSTLTMIGHHGQTNYLAANMFMTELASQRRQRGSAGSVIHVGYVTDTGYTTRIEASRRDFLSRQHVNPISETDVHHAFAEAIISGRPGSHRPCEIGLGLDPLRKPLDQSELPPWLLDPRLSHYLPPSHIREEKEATRAGPDNLKERIRDADSEEEAICMLRPALSSKLEVLMQISTDKVDFDVPFTQLGIDSLVAVEIRTWFLKELDVDLPVMKLLGRESITQICANAIKISMARSLDSVSDTATSAGLTTPIESQGTPDDSQHQSESSMSDTDIDPTLDSSPMIGKKINFVPGDDNNEKSQREIVETQALSPSQLTYFFWSEFNADPAAINCVYRYNLHGELDIARLEAALALTMQHHQALRTCFFVRPEDARPMQGVLRTPVHRFKYVPHATPQDITDEVEAGKVKVWDLEHGETVGLTVLSRSLQVHALVLSHHHLIMDGVGLRNLLLYLDRAYQGLATQNSVPSYIDYMRNEAKKQKSPMFQRRLQYWKQEFTNAPQVLPLAPMANAKARSQTLQFSATHVWRDFGEDMGGAIKATCEALQITPFHFHLSVFQVLLSHLLGIDDICIATADANRSDAQSNDLVGCIMHMMPLRFRISKETRLTQLLRSTSRKVLNAMENSGVSLFTILDSLSIPRSGSYFPLCQACLNYRQGFATEMPLAGNTLRLVDGRGDKTGLDFLVGIVDFGSAGSKLEFAVQDSLYDRETASILLDVYLNLVKTFTSNLNMTVSQCGIKAFNSIGQLAGGVTSSKSDEAAQVKVRGHYVNLNEIEARLLDCGKDTISKAAVVSKDDNLIAYCVKTSKGCDDREMNERILDALPLPHYMRPERMFFVDQLPLKHSGKIDHEKLNQLPHPKLDDESKSSSKLVLLESQLGCQWEQILPVLTAPLTSETNFFQVGGNSLLLIRLQQMIRKDLGVYVPARELYSVPTLRQMAARIYFKREDQAQDKDILVS